jgi:hypothetical protein
MADQKIVILGLYSTREAVDSAMNQFASAGFPSSDISVLLADGREAQSVKSLKASASARAPATSISEETKESTAGRVENLITKDNELTPTTGTGAGIGAVAGSAALGWVATLTALAIPGLGPFLVVGPIIGAIAGGAAGGAVGALSGVGIPEKEAKLYEDRLKKGGTLVSVHTDAVSQAERAKAILIQTGATEITSTVQS